MGDGVLVPPALVVELLPPPRREVLVTAGLPDLPLAGALLALVLGVPFWVVLRRASPSLAAHSRIRRRSVTADIQIIIIVIITKMLKW